VPPFVWARLSLIALYFVTPFPLNPAEPHAAEPFQQSSFPRQNHGQWDLRDQHPVTMSNNDIPDTTTAIALAGNTQGMGPTASTIPMSETTPSTTLITTSPTTSPVVPSGGSGISGKLAAGPVAGIAVGSAIAGALIGILALSLLFGKKRKGKRGDVYNIKDGATSSTIPIATASAAGIVESHLPQPLPDTDIGRLLSSIDTRLVNHMISFYGPDAPATDEDIAAAITAASASGTPLPVSSEKLASLLTNPAHRSFGLRIVASSILLSRVGIEAPPEESLLPPGMASAIHSMPPIASGDHGKPSIILRV
jgi:hypothetical protein